jgi:hypothetical protein
MASFRPRGLSKYPIALCLCSGSSFAQINWYQTDGTYKGTADDFKAAWTVIAAAVKNNPKVKMYVSVTCLKPDPRNRSLTSER